MSNGIHGKNDGCFMQTINTGCVTILGGIAIIILLAFIMQDPLVVIGIFVLAIGVFVRNNLSLDIYR